MLALNGPVGADKSRFCQQLIGLAQERGLRLEVAPIDDAYCRGSRPGGHGGQPLRREVAAIVGGGGSAPLGAEQAAWRHNWDRQLEAYGPLFDLCDGLWMLRPLDWGLPKRWSLQSVDQQRRLQPQSPKLDGWLKPLELDRLMNSSLAALPPRLYQEPLTAPTKGFGQLNGRRASHRC